MKPKALYFFSVFPLFFILQAAQVGIIFSHKLHTQEAGAACRDCHGEGGRILPAKTSCYVCHEQDSTACGLCHTDPKHPTGYPRRSVIANFSHEVHAEKGIGCDRCHKGVETAVTSAERHMPLMADCQSCHPFSEGAEYCRLCHASGERLLPEDHRLDLRHGHAAAARVEALSCRRCHSESKCLSCHRRDNLDRRVHPLNYLRTHGRESLAKRDDCLSCHDDQRDCVACHREQMVMPRAHHTAGWSNRTNGGLHAKQGRLDLEHCSACHSGAQPICRECHHAKP